MKGKNLLILVLLAVALAALAVLTSRKEKELAPDLLGRYVLPNLPVNDIEKIVVYSEQSTVTVTRVDNVWLSPDKFNYPVDFGKVRECLLKLAELRIGQMVQVDNDERSELKIISPLGELPSDSHGIGTLVELRGKGDKKLASLLVGDTHQRKTQGRGISFGGYPDGHYVSPDNGGTIYLITETLDDLPRDVKNWLDTNLVNVPSSDIKEVTISGPRRDTVRLTRKKDGGGLDVEGLSAKEETDSSKLQGIESALSYLRFDDIADPSITEKELDMGKPVIFKALTQKNEVYTVNIGGSPEGSNNRYVRIEVALEKPDKPVLPAAETEGKKKDSPQDTEKKQADERKELEIKIKALNENLRKWTYLMASYKTDSMTATRNDLVKEKEKKKEE